MSSIMRRVNRGRAKILFNPDTELFETYELSCRGVWMRAGERLGLKQVEARDEKYKARAEELQEIKEAEEKAAIQKRARKLEA